MRQLAGEATPASLRRCQSTYTTAKWPHRADAVLVDGVHDSFSANGYMMNAVIPSVEVQAGASAMLDITFWGSDLEENSISAVSDITEFEVALELQSGNSKWSEAALSVRL